MCVPVIKKVESEKFEYSKSQEEVQSVHISVLEHRE